MNSSSISITFTIYNALGVFRLVLLVGLLLLYVSCLCMNLLLVLVICLHSRLHRPMYVLLVNLSLSGVMGSSSVCPQTIRQLTRGGGDMSLRGCLTQTFFTNIYSGCMFCILGLMAYDRYVSVCRPLLYHAIMRPAKLRLMLALLYLSLGVFSAVQVNLVSALTLCRHSVDGVLCSSLVIASLSCTRSPLISVYTLCCSVLVIAVPFVLVILSYVHILAVVLKASGERRRKAVRTCTPHLVTFIHFSVSSFFGVIYNSLSHQVPKAVNIFTYLSFFVIPPLLHPIIYGIKMREIRQSVKKMLKVVR